MTYHQEHGMAVLVIVVQIHAEDTGNGPNDGNSKGGRRQHQFNLQTTSSVKGNPQREGTCGLSC